MSSFWRNIAWGVLIIAGGLLVGYAATGLYQTFDPPASHTTSPISLEKGEVHKAKRVRVVEGHVFDVYLENRKRYLVALEGVLGTPPEAKEHVIRLLNKSQDEGHSVTITPRHWDDRKDRWLVDVYFNSQGTTLTEWLRVRELIYSR